MPLYGITRYSCTSQPTSSVQLSAFAAAKKRALRTSKADPADIQSETSQHIASSDNEIEERDSPFDQEYESDALPEAYVDRELSTWIPSNDNIVQRTAKSISVILRAQERLAIIGQYQLTVKNGSIDLYGATLPRGSTRYLVYAPSTHPLPVITGPSVNSAEIEIRVCDNLLYSLSAISPLFSSIGSSGSNYSGLFSSLKGLAYLQHASDDPEKRRLFPLELPSTWMKLLRELSHASQSTSLRLMICGTKRCGKSTFGRHLLNRIIASQIRGRSDVNSIQTFPRSVYYLDLDPSLPEFLPPGQISLTEVRMPLFGPSYAHTSAENNTSFRIVKAHSLTSIDPLEDLQYYLDSAADLLHFYNRIQAQKSRNSLIVMCPGGASGLIVDTLTELIKMTEPTDILFIERADSMDAFASLSQSLQGISLHSLKGFGPSTACPTSRSLRAMQYMSYFHSIPTSGHEFGWSSRAMTSMPQFPVRYGPQSSADIIGILSLGEQPHEDSLAVVLDGTIVAICLIESSGTLRSSIQNIEHTTTEGLPYWPPNSSGLGALFNSNETHFIGLAYVSRVDLEKKCINLVTPVSHGRLRTTFRHAEDGLPRAFLLRGKFEIPEWACLENLYLDQQGEYDDVEDEENDLVINLEDLPTPYDVGHASWTDEIPWVKRLRPGETVAKRFRVRRNLGRPTNV